MPEMTSKPESQRALGPSKLVLHGKATKRFVSMIGKMRNVSEFTLDEWRQIHEDHGPIHLQPALVGLSPAPSLVSSASFSFQSLEEQTGPKERRSRKQHANASKAQRRPIPSFSDDQTDNAESSEADDDEDELEGLLDQDPKPTRRRHTASTLSSSPPPDLPRPKTKPFFEPTEFVATQETNDDDDAMPDLSDLLGSKNTEPLSSPLIRKRVQEDVDSGRGRRERRRRILVEEDSDE